MTSKYVDHPGRLAYIQKLYRDPLKANFKQTWRFCNAILMDACEQLFSALKSWVYGNKGDSVTLLMAIVRISQGCRSLVIRRFLHPVSVAVKQTVAHTGNGPAKTLFKAMCLQLTSWAVQRMYTDLQACWLAYELTYEDDNDVAEGDASTDGDDETGDEYDRTTTVTSKAHFDRFKVRSDCTCWLADRRCWQQSYSGLLCNHAILAIVEKLTTCTDNKKKIEICEKSISLCHKNWLRSTYSNAQLPTKIPKPPPLREPMHDFDAANRDYVYRFREVLQYVPSSAIQKVLRSLEMLALTPEEPDEPGTSVLSSTNGSSRSSSPCSLTSPGSQTQETDLFDLRFSNSLSSPLDDVLSCASSVSTSPPQSPVTRYRNPDKRRKKNGTYRGSPNPKKGRRIPNNGSHDTQQATSSLHRRFRPPEIRQRGPFRFGDTVGESV